MHELYGLTVMLVVVAVLTPLAEEFIFRGALLQAFRGRVSFWFAALVQALAFVLMHEEWQSMPYLFVFALVCAWLARRSQGLLAPVVLHGVNNAIAALGVAGLTQAINH
jgi:membrane protease YdiL (CAAX protease family)